MTVLGEIVARAPAPLRPYARPEPGPQRFAQAAGPAGCAAAASDDGLGERLFVMEAVYEGYLLHYGESRLFEGMDEDLRLLAGDALYALGLARLAESGDLPAVAELSDLIGRSAQAHAEGRGDEAEALWDASAAALASAAR